MTKENNLETLNLIWLDSSLNEDQESLVAQKDFRQLVHQFRPFTNEIECEKFINQTTIDDRIALIISGAMSLTLMPKIHQKRQLFAIYIYCMNKKKYEEAARPFPKVRGIQTTFDDLIDQIRNDLKKRVENPIDEPFLIGRNETTNLHYRLLIESLLQMPSSTNDDEKQQFVRFVETFYKDNEKEKKSIRNFCETYRPNSSIFWAMRDNFLSRILSKSIRTSNLDILFLLRFFIRDFQNEVEQNRCSTSIRVYRGQIVSISELDELKSSIGSIVSFPMCFSASTDRKFPMNSLENYSFRNGEEKLLFEIEGKPSKTNDNEFVFEFASIFQLKSVTREQPGLSIVRLTSIDDEFRPSNRFQLDVDRSSNLSFGNFLFQIGKFSLAEQFFRQILKNFPEGNLDGRLRCLHALGLVTLAKDDFPESLRFHDESLKLCGVDDPRAAEIYHCLGCVEQKRNDFARALQFYEIIRSEILQE